MVVPVTGTIPDSTLSPAQVRAKFSSQSLSGLGDAWCTDPSVCTAPIMGTDPDTGDPIQTGCGGCSTDYTSPGSGTTLPTCGDAFGTYACPTSGSPITLPSTPSSGSSITNTYMSAGGNQIITYSDGTWSLIGVTGVVTNGSGSPPAAAQGTISTAQANAWPSVINALAQAGVKLGTIALLPAGATLLPNGTIVGSGQRVVTPGLSLNLGSLSSILTNPVVLIGGFGLIALLALSGRR